MFHGVMGHMLCSRLRLMDIFLLWYYLAHNNVTILVLYNIPVQ